MLRVVSSRRLGEDSIFNRYQQVEIKPAGFFRAFGASEKYLLPPGSRALAPGQVLERMPVEALPVEDMPLWIRFAGMVANGVRVLKPQWGPLEGHWEMHVALERDARLFELLSHQAWLDTGLEEYRRWVEPLGNGARFGIRVDEKRIAPTDGCEVLQALDYLCMVAEKNVNGKNGRPFRRH